MQQTKVAILAVAASAVIIAGAIYIMHLRAELSDARRQLGTVEAETQRLTDVGRQVEGALAAASKELEQLRAEVSNARSGEKVADGSKEVEALRNKITALEAEVAYRKKVSTWWRDLFDYTKPFKTTVASRMAG